MALCAKCDRPLSANGKCLYCGTLEGAEAVEARLRRRSVGAAWVRHLLKLALAAGLCALAYWMLFTPGGRAFTERVKRMIGTSSDNVDSAWVKALKKHPKIKELLGSKLNTTVEEEELAGEPTVHMVTIARRDGSELLQYAFRVNAETGEVTPLGYLAESVMADR